MSLNLTSLCEMQLLHSEGFGEREVGVVCELPCAHTCQAALAPMLFMTSCPWLVGKDTRESLTPDSEPKPGTVEEVGTRLGGQSACRLVIPWCLDSDVLGTGLYLSEWMC